MTTKILPKIGQKYYIIEFIFMLKHYNYYNGIRKIVKLISKIFL